MGLIMLHSAHHSKIFRRLMGTSCDLRWRDIGERDGK
jgi:trehalose utilization protein